MMSENQYLLCKIAEECAEVAQRAMKSQQFGLEEVQKGQDFTNAQRLVQEMKDLIITFDMLAVVNGFTFEPSEAEYQERNDKMVKFLKLAQSLGEVDKPA